MEATQSPSRKKTYQRPQPLDVFFTPKTVALVGATENPGSVGRTILWNLVTSPFGGTVYPVNPKRPNVLGVKAYPSISDIPEQVDLAVIVTPPPSIPGIIRECGQNGVRGAVIISAGFKETGPEGAALERQVLEEARAAKIRVIGPNCLGVMAPLSGLNATFATTIARPGSVGFISQSGALCTAVLDWSLKEMVGFSAFISVGSMVDVSWGDMIYHLGNDPKTRSIVIYMETIGNARSFLSAAREVAFSKPIIVIKPGRTAAAAKAAASHTGSLTGSDEVLEAAFRRSGVLRVNNIADLFYMAEVLSKQPRPKGPRLTIVTNAGGPGVLATDALITGGGELAELSPETMEAYNAVLPPTWSHNNPVDIIGDASPERYAKALEIAAKDPHSDGMLVILTPQAMTDPTRIAEQLRPLAEQKDKPVIASWMGGVDVAAGEEVLNRANIPTFPYPDTAARAFNYMWQYAYNLKGLYETPAMPEDEASGFNRKVAADEIIQKTRKAGRTILTEFDSKQILSAYGIPVAKTVVAATEGEAVAAGREIGYPVVLKLFSETITHKTDVGSVQLNLSDEEAVGRAFRAIQSSVAEKVGAQHFQGVTVQPMVKLKDAYELILGSSLDPQFGPVLLFGMGGQLVEVFKDRALALPPLNTTLARRMMEQTKIYKALEGVRGRRGVDMHALEMLLVRFSALVAEQRWIKEIDINPLLASPDGLIALDARVVVYGPEVPEGDIAKMAIRPYPTRYVGTWTAKDGTEVTIRPIRPEDEPAMVHFHETLSDQSVYYRYFHLMNLEQRVRHERLMRTCFIDYDREMAMVAERRNPETGEPEILAVSRMTKIQWVNEAEVAIIVSDRWQGRGLGKELMARLQIIASDEKLERLTADMLPENRSVMRVCEKLGFKLHHSLEDEVVRAEFEMRASAEPQPDQRD
ncbi:MAG TPA: bifunctional acetate--CoA ligase family protein/GNAT family N-acetyltransferase [Bryobacteraceae bacterium]|jgi:acetyltransferase|nr:bifunctional acetate--CoA ligase family protein/GNAT family N-acetyltransferase [Bryobacteraceae bacterium]